MDRHGWQNTRKRPQIQHKDLQMRDQEKEITQRKNNDGDDDDDDDDVDDGDDDDGDDNGASPSEIGNISIFLTQRELCGRRIGPTGRRPWKAGKDSARSR